MKILANDGISASGIAALEKAGIEVVTEKVEQDQLAQAINDNQYTGILVRSATTVRKDLIDACPSLQLIGRGGVGMDNIDVEYARSKGINVFNTPAASSQSVAELAFAHMLSIARSVYDANRQMPTNGASDFKTLKKKYAKGFELRGKTLGIIGFGRIGKALATYALGCGMNVKFNTHSSETVNLTLDIAGAGDVNIALSPSSLNEVLAESDFISLHVPSQKDGSPVITAEAINQMKEGVILINTARGGSIDEDALLEGLNNGKVAAAALDVFTNEPSPRVELLHHPKISLTPHIGAATQEAQDRIGTELAEKIITHFAKEPA